MLLSYYYINYIYRIILTSPRSLKINLLADEIKRF